MFLTKEELIASIQQEVRSLDSYLVEVDYSNALEDSLRETGWEFPASSSSKEYWMKTRAKRHLFFYLLSESAHKFKIKSINLDQRFTHYKALVETMDKSFYEFMSTNPDLFEGIDSSELFSNHIDPNFGYSVTGKYLGSYPYDSRRT